MTKIYNRAYYILLNDNGNPVTINAQLPIYWNRSVAVREALKFKAHLFKVELQRPTGPIVLI